MDQKKLNGRQASGNSFLRGLIRHTSFSDIAAIIDTDDSEETVYRALGTDAHIRPIRIIPYNIKELSELGCLFFPGPNFDNLSYARLAHHPRAFSLCGITHTTASCLDLFAKLPAAPIFSWDAIICTSQSVRDTMRYVLEEASAYYAWRFGGTGRAPQLQMPLIPLGLNSGDFAINADLRKQSRASLGLAEEDIAVLFLGRLSFHSKVNPGAMFIALEEAARAASRQVVLVLCGWFSSDTQKNVFVQAVQNLAPSLDVRFVDGRNEENRKHCWSAADIFCSLSDNIQETFGLTPLEGMAAGLPVVVTDWDGYRDTVRHGIDGFRIRTIIPAPPIGDELAHQFAAKSLLYDHYILQASQVTSLDLDECVAALTALISSPDLRKKMGQAGQKRAREVFDWKCIIQQYEELWGELEERRRADAEPTVYNAPSRMPGYPNPFEAFGSYATEKLESSHTIWLRVANPIKDFQVRSQLSLYQSGQGMCLSNVYIERMLQEVSLLGKTTVAALTAIMPKETHAHLQQSILWCAKMGIIQIGSCESS